MHHPVQHLEEGQGQEYFQDLPVKIPEHQDQQYSAADEKSVKSESDEINHGMNPIVYIPG